MEYVCYVNGTVCLVKTICGQVTTVGIAAYTCNTLLVNDLYLHFNKNSDTKGKILQFCRWQQLCAILVLRL